MTKEQKSLQNTVNPFQKTFNYGMKEIDEIIAQNVALNAEIQGLESALEKVAKASMSIKNALTDLIAELLDNKDRYQKKTDDLPAARKAYQAQVTQQVASINKFLRDEVWDRIKQLQDQQDLMKQIA